MATTVYGYPARLILTVRGQEVEVPDGWLRHGELYLPVVAKVALAANRRHESGSVTS